MNNLVLLLTTFTAIIFIVGIVLIQKPETKKTGYLLIISVAISIVIKYFSYNYVLDLDSLDNSAGENITELIVIFSMFGLAASPFVFLIGLFLAIKGSKYPKIGTYVYD